MNCFHSGCENEVPEGRRKFCSDTCVKRFHRSRSCTPSARELSKANVLDADMRVCLSCDEQFLSDGPWNRLCPKCKRREVYQ